MFLSFFLMSFLQATETVHPLLFLPDEGCWTLSIDNPYYAERLGTNMGPWTGVKRYCDRAPAEDQSKLSNRDLIEEEFHRILALPDLPESMKAFVEKLIEWLKTFPDTTPLPNHLFPPEFHPEGPESRWYAFFCRLVSCTHRVKELNPFSECATTSEHKLAAADLQVLAWMLLCDRAQKQDNTSSVNYYVSLIKQAMDTTPLTATMKIMRCWYQNNEKYLNGYIKHLIYYPGFPKARNWFITACVGTGMTVFAAMVIWRTVVAPALDPDASCADGKLNIGSPSEVAHAGRGFHAQNATDIVMNALDLLVNPAKVMGTTACQRSAAALAAIAASMPRGTQGFRRFYESSPGTPPDVWEAPSFQPYNHTIDTIAGNAPGCPLGFVGGNPGVVVLGSGGIWGAVDRFGTSAIFYKMANQFRPTGAPVTAVPPPSTILQLTTGAPSPAPTPQPTPVPPPPAILLPPPPAMLSPSPVPTHQPVTAVPPAPVTPLPSTGVPPSPVPVTPLPSTPGPTPSPLVVTPAPLIPVGNCTFYTEYLANHTAAFNLLRNVLCNATTLFLGGATMTPAQLMEAIPALLQMVNLTMIKFNGALLIGDAEITALVPFIQQQSQLQKLEFSATLMSDLSLEALKPILTQLPNLFRLNFGDTQISAAAILAALSTFQQMMPTLIVLILTRLNLNATTQATLTTGLPSVAIGF